MGPFAAYRRVVVHVLALVCVAIEPARAWAIPAFGHAYAISCQKCHSVIPHLNAFGAAFAANGYRIPGVQPGPAIPISVKTNLAYSSDVDPHGLPKAIVDEIELLSAGTIGARTSYFVEQYLVDGGEHGSTRDGWLAFRLSGDGARVPLVAAAGSFTLPLPVDPETFRISARHYALFDQTVGSNPFNFFDPKIGAQLRVGNALAGSSVTFVVAPGHDQQSGLQTRGTDAMAYVQHAAGPFTVSAYRYGGERPIAPRVLDRFFRDGVGLTYTSRRWTSESVLQTGWDSNAGVGGVATGGGFTQLRYDFSPRLFALARYEGTQDARGVARDGVLLLGMRPAHVARVTIEDVIAHAPRRGHTLNLQYTVGY